MRRATFDEHRRFCQVDGWLRTADGPGRTVSKHEVWTKILPTGDLLRTSISKGRGDYGPGLFTRIVKRQLRVTIDEFWAAVDRGVAPARVVAASPRPQGTMLPLSAVLRLRSLGLTEAQMRKMTADDVAGLLAELHDEQ